MLFRLDDEARLDELQAELKRAHEITPELLSKVMAGTCARSASQQGAIQSALINRLSAAQAWTETALALVEFDLPRWKLRRLAYQDRAWLCTLSRCRSLPGWLSDEVEFRHESLQLAILGALVEARRLRETAAPMRGSVPSCPSDPQVETVCCDNFA
jgi:hypothetical protein